MAERLFLVCRDWIFLLDESADAISEFGSSNSDTITSKQTVLLVNLASSGRGLFVLSKSFYASREVRPILEAYRGFWMLLLPSTKRWIRRLRTVKYRKTIEGAFDGQNRQALRGKKPLLLRNWESCSFHPPSKNKAQGFVVFRVCKNSGKLSLGVVRTEIPAKFGGRWSSFLNSSNDIDARNRGLIPP